MQGFVAKTFVLGLIAAGFFMTGDLPWISEQARNWAQGHSVASPGEKPAFEEARPQPQKVVAPPQEKDASQAASETVRQPGTETSDTSAVSTPQTAVVGLPSMTAQQVNVTQLQAGDRILVRTDYELVAYDLIDPQLGDAVEHRHAIIGAYASAAALTAPRRVLLPNELTVGRSIMLTIPGSMLNSNAEPAGIISALAVEKPLD